MRRPRAGRALRSWTLSFALFALVAVLGGCSAESRDELLSGPSIRSDVARSEGGSRPVSAESVRGDAAGHDSLQPDSWFQPNLTGFSSAYSDDCSVSGDPFDTCV